MSLGIGGMSHDEPSAASAAAPEVIQRAMPELAEHVLESPVSQVAFDLALRARRGGAGSILKQPWEEGSCNPVFGKGVQTVELSLPAVGFREFFSSSHQAVAPQGMPHQGSIPDFVQRRIRFTKLVTCDDASRWEALRKIKVVVMCDPAASPLGRSLLADAKTLCSEDELRNTFMDVFASKATATLVKRASSIWRFSEWVLSNELGSPVRATESVLYRYMSYLKDAGSPTTASSFLQAWNFFTHAIGLDKTNVERQLSSRVRGAAQMMFQQKRPLRQASPLTVKMVRCLEDIVHKAPYLHWKVIAGHLLFCLGSSSRFGDSLRLKYLKFSSAADVHLIEAESFRYKTQTSSEKKTRMLPLLSLGNFFGKLPWGPEWKRAREEAGLSSSPSLPAWSEISSAWLQRPMSTGEASLYLQEFLVSSRFSMAALDKIRSHSLKCTVLSWAAKHWSLTALTMEERRLLGHHLDPHHVSVVTYGRDELTKLMGKVQSMVQEIRDGSFEPDASRVWRLAKISNPNAPEQRLGLVVQEGDPYFESSDDNEDDDFGVDHLSQPAPRLERDRANEAEQMDLSSMRVHLFSKVVHILGSRDGRFKCGRVCSKNFGDLDPYLAVADMPMCSQCSGHQGPLATGTVASEPPR